MADTSERDKTHELTRKIKALAIDIGFDACGISKVAPLPNERKRLDHWLAKGCHAEMDYMAGNRELRISPAKLLPGARSIISLVASYYPKKEMQADGRYRIARYALGRDYHSVLKRKMKKLMALLQQENSGTISRAFTDSAPVFEKALAVRAGLGWIGKNTCLIRRETGSFIFTSEIITSRELDYDEPFTREYCGTCTRCIDACPTGALSPYSLDARKCISYLTIEYKGKDLPGDMKRQFGERIFGCDTCQEVCPWNRAPAVSRIHEFEPLPVIRELEKPGWKDLTETGFNEKFRGSPLKRLGYNGLKRNIEFVNEYEQKE